MLYPLLLLKASKRLIIYNDRKEEGSLEGSLNHLVLVIRKI